MNLYANRKRPLYEFFTIDGVSSLNFGIRISDNGDLDGKAERDIISQPIPGRNGELTIDNGRYLNKDFSFQCWIADGYPVNLDGFADFLNQSHGYHIVEDTYHPGEHILARVVGQIDPRTLSHNSGSFEIPFNRMPQRFDSRLRRHGHYFPASGQPKMLRNPYNQPAFPRIEITPDGVNTTVQLYFNAVKLLTVTQVTSTLVIDSERREITMGGVSKLADTTFHEETIADNFPVLEPGITGMNWDAHATGVVFPNWWHL